MDRIQVLNENVINQIAAGEVIERPASVIKELVENSIDSKATKIEVEIANGGRYLRVSDNGSGIHPEDVQLAFSRHATSKISIESDLWQLNTLGFRGEALASILSISKVVCTTKTRDGDNGIKLINTDNNELKLNPFGCAKGTTIEVKDLFYNVPARLKFLKKQNTEIAAVIEVLQNLAIAHPEIAFVCKNLNKTVLKTSGSNDLCITLGELFSKDLINHLLQVNALDQTEKYFISGVISDPEFTKSNKKSIYIIVNGRFIKCPILTKAIERGFENILPSGRFPLAVINLMIPAEKLDVNVHPTKKEVRYISTNSVFSFVNYAVKKALQDGDYCISCSRESNTPLSLESNKESNIKIILPEKEAIDTDSNQIAGQKLLQCPLSTNNFNKEKNIIDLSKTKQEIRHKEPIKQEITKSAVDFYKPLEKPENKEEVTKNVNFEYAEQLKIHPVEKLVANSERKTWHIIGQAYNTYIILQSDDGLIIVDQHIASERALYDKLKRKEHIIAGQRLLIFEDIKVSIEHMALIDEYAEQLEKWCYEIEKSDYDKIKIKQVPQMLTGKDYRAIFEDLINLLEDGGSVESLEDNFYKTLACHAAVRAGDILNIKEMEEVISLWQKSDYPYTCPHGRKISHKIPVKELSSFFDRQVKYIGSI